MQLILVSRGLEIRFKVKKLQQKTPLADDGLITRIGLLFFLSRQREGVKISLRTCPERGWVDRLLANVGEKGGVFSGHFCKK